MGHMGLSGLLIELLTAGGVRNLPGQLQQHPSLLGGPRSSPEVILEHVGQGVSKDSLLHGQDPMEDLLVHKPGE